MRYAETVIKTKGVHSIKPKSVTVKIIPGQKKFGGKWCWLWIDPVSQPNGMWVQGLCSNWGKFIQIAGDPNNLNSVDGGTLSHEFAHHWLIANGHYDMHHYPIYDNFFENWGYARQVTGMTIKDLPYIPFHYNIKTTNDIISVSGIIEKK